MNFEDIKYKQDLIQNLPQLILNNRKNYEIYFLTLTFKRTHHQVRSHLYRDYLKRLYQKINQHSVNRSTHNTHRKCKILLIPEKSHVAATNKLTNSHHYHGFLFIHRDVQEKFERICIQESKEDNITRSKLSDFIVSKRKHDIISLYSSDIQYLDTEESIKRVSHYITKKFQDSRAHNLYNPETNNIDLSYSDIIDFQRIVPHMTKHRTIFSYEDIEIFCHFHEKTESSDRINSCISQSIQRTIQMTKTLSFKEFIDVNFHVDEDTYKTIVLLSESHPTIQNDSTIQRLLNDKSARVSVSELSSVIRKIHQRSVYLARTAANVPDGQKLLIIAEQNVLTISASALAAAISARLQNSIERMSRVNQATSALRR